MSITSRQLEADEVFKANGAKLRYLEHLVNDGEIDLDSDWGETVQLAIDEGEAAIVEDSEHEEAETVFACTFCTNEISYDELDSARSNGGLCSHCASAVEEG